MAKIMFDGPGKSAAIFLENEKDISAMVDLLYHASKTKLNKRSNAYKLLIQIDDELPIC